MRRFALALLLLLSASACSDSGSSEPEAAESTTTTTRAESAPAGKLRLQEYDVPAGSRPHDVAVTKEGIVWYTAQGSGELGRLDPSDGRVEEVALGKGSRPHGVIIGPDGAPWVTDSGLNAIVRVDPTSREIRAIGMPADRPAVNVHTAVFDAKGTLWFTGNAGVYGKVTVSGHDLEVFDAPRGGGPYGITATPNGDIYFASLSQSYIARVDPVTGRATVIEPPTRQQGSRRVWTDSGGRIWSSQWNAGQVALYDPATKQWKEWKLPGANPQAYSVFVDDRDVVWLSDFGANALVRFDPATEQFTSLPLPSRPGEVRQMHGRPGEVWGAESAADKLVVVRT